jgi:hypothetical protein
VTPEVLRVRAFRDTPRDQHRKRRRQKIDGTLPGVIYNTEIFEVADVDDFRRALESLRDVMTDAGGSDLRIYRSVDDPTKVLAGMFWPDAETCRAFSLDHAAEIASVLRPALTSHQPEDLWEEV